MWIKDLGEYYSHNRQVPKIRVDMLLKTFGKLEQPILDTAAQLYMMENEHFPTVAGFKPYIKTARFQEESKTPRKGKFMYTDDEMYQIEVNQGTMRPIEEIEAEIEAARKQIAGRDV